MERIFSYDAETNGLWGAAFAIAAITSDGQQFVGRCPIEGNVNPWVAENVLPQMENIPVNFKDYRSLLEAFCAFWMENKGTALVHMGQPVEARLWIDAHRMGIIGDWDAPYIQVDLVSFSEVGDSVDTYNREHGIAVSPEDLVGGAHNPLYDSAQALRCYEDLKKKGRL